MDLVLMIIMLVAAYLVCGFIYFKTDYANLKERERQYNTDVYFPEHQLQTLKSFKIAQQSKNGYVLMGIMWTLF